MPTYLLGIAIALFVVVFAVLNHVVLDTFAVVKVFGSVYEIVEVLLVFPVALRAASAVALLQQFETVVDFVVEFFPFLRTEVVFIGFDGINGLILRVFLLWSFVTPCLY